MTKYLWFVAMVILNMLDWATTSMILERGGMEANPLLVPVIEAGLFDAVKLYGTTLAITLVFALVKWDDYRVSVSIIKAVTIVYGLFAFTNTLQLVFG
jgi:hypothetical protein